MSDWLNTIKSINGKYVSARNRFDTLLALNQRISEEVNSHITTEIISRNMGWVSDALQKTNEEDYPMLRDVLALGNQYMDSVSAVMSYRKALLSSNQDITVASSITKVKEAQKKYDKTKVQAGCAEEATFRKLHRRGIRF